MVKVGDKILIEYMDGEPQYTGKTGIVTSVNADPWGDVQIHGTWGGCCLYEGKDSYTIIEKAE